jgi:hypothetical protein
MPSGPLGHDIGNDDAVVIGGEPVVRAGGPDDVDAVHPRVTSQDDIDCVAECPGLAQAVDELLLRHRPSADESRHATAGFRCLRAGNAVALDDLSG